MKNAAVKQTSSRDQRLAVVSDEPANHSAYAEYVRGFDDIPVLQDAVRIPPRRSVEPDFRRGERRDARKELRPDAYAIREANSTDLQLLYQEYSQPIPTSARPKRKKSPKRKSKGKKR